jgi:hypothetical protein
MDRTREAEQAVLGAMMLDPARSWAAVDGILEQAHFIGPDHRAIFGAMLALRERGLPPDAVTVCDELGPLLEAVGGSGYVASIVEGTPSAANVAAYAKLVREAFDKRKIIDLGERISARAGNGVDAAEAGALAQQEIEQLNRNLGGQIKPLALEPVSAWADQLPPKPREWVLEGLIPAGKVTSLLGPGGKGKTLVALQIGLHVSLGKPIFGVATTAGPVLGIFCEDDHDELQRRVRAACAAERFDLADARQFVPISREGEDTALCTFERDHIRLEHFHRVLEATIAAMRPRLVILDTAADMFLGDFMSTPHVRQFLKIALGGLCARYGCAILLLAHPSKAGQTSGEGDGFSTAWNNSVRSRLYFRAQKAANDDSSPDDPDHRVLELKKANYGPSGTKIPLLYQSGSFVIDPAPIEQMDARPKTKTGKLAIAAYDFVRSRYPANAGFRETFDHLQANGDLPEGPYETLRKTLSRALKQLVEEGLIEDDYPRGYRSVKSGT